jgi:hypothetical protein
MDGWRISFNYQQDQNEINVEILGSQSDIQVGLGLVVQTVGRKVQEMLDAHDISSQLLYEAVRLLLARGDDPVAEFKGRYLDIEPMEIAGGLGVVCNVR